MGGTNPYIEPVRADRPQQPYDLTFVLGDEGGERTVRVDPAALPYGHDGLPGSVLDVAMGAGIPLDHACGGVCACSTCHVVVEQGGESMNAVVEAEEDMLDHAPGVTATSRLACQAVADGSASVRVRVPGWNRNLVAEGPH